MALTNSEVSSRYEDIARPVLEQTTYDPVIQSVCIRYAKGEIDSKEDALYLLVRLMAKRDQEKNDQKLDQQRLF